MRAAIDIGSNSILLAIAKAPLADQKLELVYDEARVIGLVKGVRHNGRISSESVDRAIHCLKDYLRIVRDHDPNAKLQVVATESLRLPQNGLEVKAQLEEVLGRPIELISGEREAELSFWSVEKEFPSQSGEKAMVFDIGGASTEVICGDSNGPQSVHSLKMGSVLLTEEFNLDQPSQAAPALDFVMSKLADSKLKGFENVTRAVGVAGTMTSLIAVEKKLERYERSRVHGQEIAKERVEFWLNEILSMPLENRQKLVGLQPERADVFGGGLVILKGLMDFFGWDRVTCADSGVRLGLLYADDSENSM